MSPKKLRHLPFDATVTDKAIQMNTATPTLISFRRTALLASLCIASQVTGCAVAAFTQKWTQFDLGVSRYPTKTALLKSMGGPTEIECKPGKQERWIYKGDQRLGGVFIWALFVPLPLMVPIGRDSLTIELDGEQVTSSTQSMVEQCEYSVVAAPSSPLGRNGATVGSCGFKASEVEGPRIDAEKARTFCSSH
jgi:hypothetical protein